MIETIWLLCGSAVFLAGMACGMRIAELNLRQRERRLAAQRRILNGQKSDDAMDRWRTEPAGGRTLVAP